MADRQKLAEEIERLHIAASPAPWVSHPGVKRERLRGAFWSVCKGFPQKPVGQMSGQETSSEREANMDLVCILRSHVPEILAALRAQDREDGAREMRDRAIARVQDRAYLLEHGEPQAAVLRAVRDVAALPLSPARKEDGNA